MYLCLYYLYFISICIVIFFTQIIFMYINNLFNYIKNITHKCTVNNNILQQFYINNYGLTITTPKNGRIIFVGDIHGCYHEFLEILEKSQFQPKDDLLIILGDAIGKGPYSYKVLKYIINLGKSCILLRGNHEQIILDYYNHIKSNNSCTFYCMPSKLYTHKQFALKLNSQYLQYLNNTPIWINIPQLNILALHAGIIPLYPIYQHSSRVIMNLRRIYTTDTIIDYISKYSLSNYNYNKYSDYVYEKSILDTNKKTTTITATTTNNNSNNNNNNDSNNNNNNNFKPYYWAALYSLLPTDIYPHIIFGHDAKSKLQIHRNATGIDTGCCYGGHLSALIFNPPFLKLTSINNNNNKLDENYGINVPLNTPSTHYAKPILIHIPANKTYVPIKT